MDCLICGTCNPTWAWTDTNGIAQCTICGAPYNLRKPPPVICLKDEYIPAIRAYWEQNYRRMPGGFSAPGGYEVATEEEAAAFHRWLEEDAPALMTAEPDGPGVPVGPHS